MRLQLEPILQAEEVERLLIATLYKLSTPTTEQASTQKAGSPTISEHNRKTVTANHAHARFDRIRKKTDSEL